MIFWALLFLQGAQFTGSQPNGSIRTPENITVQVLDAKTVQVSWSSLWDNVERFDVTYNPTEDKIVSQAAGNSQSIVLRELRPDTQYQVTITAVVGGKNYKSRRIVFRTASDRSVISNIQPTQASHDGKAPTMASTEYITVDPTAKYMPQTSSTVRGVELGLVLLALVVWIVAIALFFHRWGKIRMLLPYQPDYKTQQSLKVPGTGTTMSGNCTGNAGTQGQQEGPGCIQHLRWSSGCNDERSTAKKGRWGNRVPPETIPPQSSSHFIRKEFECSDSPELVVRSHRERNPSADSIALCQLNRSPEKKSTGKKIESDSAGYVKLRNPESDCRKDRKRGKYVNSLDNLSDSIQSLLGYAKNQNFCQSKRNPRYDGTKSELEPLFFVGDKEFYYNHEESPDAKVVVHHCPKHADEVVEKSQQENPRPKRYTRSSFKKQKVSLYNEKELDLYMKVPIVESKPPPKKENKGTETDKPKSSSSSSRDTAEMKRKAFLRKISLQDTYLNYNQDYWLDYKKSLRFHKSIDLGYFAVEENKKPETTFEKPKPRLSERITEKSSELMDETESNCPRHRQSTSESTESGSRSAVMADFRSRFGPTKHFFTLPSTENIPLFCERNGNIETDFEAFAESRDEECLPVPGKADASVGPADDPDFQRISVGSSEPLPEESTKSDFSIDGTVNNNNNNNRYDFSQFYEIKLNADSEPVRRSTVFNFQGGHAFFGEDRTSTSDDSDVFYNETEATAADGHRYPGRILFASGSEKSRNS